MHVFHVHYRNTQGTLMRILNAISRRGVEMPYVQAAPIETRYRVTLLLDVNPKQIGQLSRDWHAIADVVDVRVSAPTREMLQFGVGWAAHPPASAADASDSARAARA